MRTSPYPVPPSRTWSVVMGGTYATLAAAGACVLAAFAVLPQAALGGVVLGLWGAASLLGSVAGLYGVARARYRWEWAGTWLIVLGTSVYLVVTILGLVGAIGLLLIGLTLTLALLALWIVLGKRWRAVGGVVGVMSAAPLVVLTVTTDNLLAVFTSAPTILVFAYAIGMTLVRAVHLSLIDMEARRQVIADRVATGEVPEVADE